MTFIISIFIIAVLFLVPSAACLFLWNLILIPTFGFCEISFWAMYGMVWFFHLISGSLIDEIMLTCSFGNSELDDIYDAWKDEDEE